jgi:hypothetical protein
MGRRILQSFALIVRPRDHFPLPDIHDHRSHWHFIGIGREHRLFQCQLHVIHMKWMLGISESEVERI